MKSTIFALLLAAGAVAATAQTPAPAPATAVHHTTAAASTGPKLPPGVPPVRGIVKTAFSLHYEDIKIGTGPLAEPNKLYKVQYTGYLGSNGRSDDGHKFDSSYDHPGPPVRGADGKPEMGADGKPKMGPPQPMSFPQGMGRLIPGFDQGFTGMKIGGKRRIFIPWQLAYGARGRPGPDEAHPGIPPKADLIFDVELVDATDLPMPPSHPGMGGSGPGMPGRLPHPGTPGAPPAPGVPPAPGAPPAPGSTPAPGNSPAPAPGATPAPTTTVPVPVTPPPATPATPPTPPTPTTPQTH